MNEQPRTNGAAHEPATRGARIRQILGIIKQFNEVGGVEADDIMKGLQATGADVSLKNLHGALMNYVQSGYIARPARGRYALTAAGERLLSREAPVVERSTPPATRTIQRKPATPPAPSPPSDVQVVDNFRAALDAFEKVVRRHAKIAAALAQSDAS